MAKGELKNQLADDPVVQRIYRIPRVRIAMVREGTVAVEQKRIGSPADVFSAVHGLLADTDREYFLVLTLNTKNCLNSINVVSIGSLNSSLAHPREVYKLAILGNAAAIICVHSHPSRDVTPSAEDIEITHRLVEAGKILGIELLDHIIIGDSYVSLKERGVV
jgi:DNA repair protein RadC